MSTIEKALGLLELFSGMRPEIGLTEFKRLTGVDKGTLHRHLTSLKNSGFLEQNPTTKAYRLGPAVLRMAAVRETTVPIVKNAKAHVDRVAKRVEELVHAALPQKNGLSAIYAMDGGARGTRVSFDEAEILPYHATSSGIAMLAFGDTALSKSAFSNQLEAFTAATSTATSEVEKLVEEAKSAGYAFSSELYEAEVCSVALPFFGQNGSAMGTLAIATPVTRMNEERRSQFIAELANASKNLSQDIGGQIPKQLKTLWP